MQNASQLSKIVATLALLVTISGVADWHYGPNTRLVPSLLPTGPMTVFGATVGNRSIELTDTVGTMLAERSVRSGSSEGTSGHRFPMISLAFGR